jgi:hypothetical protein
MSTMELSTLTHFLQIGFGDEDDHEKGLADLRFQLDSYPDGAARFHQQLSALIASGDDRLCSQILRQRACFSFDPPDSLTWFEWLQRRLLDRPG